MFYQLKNAQVVADKSVDKLLTSHFLTACSESFEQVWKICYQLVASLIIKLDIMLGIIRLVTRLFQHD